MKIVGFLNLMLLWAVALTIASGTALPSVPSHVAALLGEAFQGKLIRQGFS
jgi:hypothetical protein